MPHLVAALNGMADCATSPTATAALPQPQPRDASERAAQTAVILKFATQVGGATTALPLLHGVSVLQLAALMLLPDSIASLRRHSTFVAPALHTRIYAFAREVNGVG